MQVYAYIIRRENGMKEVIKAFKALSGETRLRVLNLVLDRECCVCEVMQALEISQSKASRHLSALYDAGFLKLRKEGLWSHYSVDVGMKEYLSDMVMAVKKALSGNEIAALDTERLRESKRAGFTCVRDDATDKLCPDNASD
jgi:ArsR family transcriptional regulator